MNDKELRERYDVVTDTWRLFKKYAERLPTKDDDKFFQDFSDEADVIWKNHGRSKFAQAEIASKASELDRLYQNEGRKKR